MSQHGFLRVAAAVPMLRVADCAYNAQRILALLARAESEQVDLVVFPELALTGYTCADLFQQPREPRWPPTEFGPPVSHEAVADHQAERQRRPLSPKRFMGQFEHFDLPSVGEWVR